MRKILLFLSILTLIILVMSLALAGGKKEVTPEEKKLTKLGYSYLSHGLHWKQMIYEVGEACEAEGIKLMAINAEINAEKQLADVEDMVHAGCEVVIIVSVDVNAVQRAVEYAHDHGVFVIADISQFKNADAYVGMSECKWGTAVGEYVGKWWSENRPGEPIYILESNADDLGGDLPKRTDCMVEAIKKYVPNTEIVLDLTCWLEECSYSNMEDALISNPEMNVFLGSNNECTYGAVTALEAAGKIPGRDVVLACVDSQYRMVELIKQGRVLCTTYVNEVEEGPLLVDTAKKLIEGTFEIGSTILFENPIIDRTNAEEYLELLSKYGLE